MRHCSYNDNTCSHHVPLPVRGVPATAFQALGERANLLHKAGRHATAAHFSTALSSLRQFRQGRDLPWDDIDSALCHDYERYLSARGLCRNTSSQYLRCLRVVFNDAVRQRLTPSRNPFACVYTGNDKTRKRALTRDEVRRLLRLDLEKSPRLLFARDMFLFSLYCRGMSLVDMSRLRKCDLRRGSLTYQRSKTGQLLHIGWLPEMERLTARHGNAQSPYLLPLLFPTPHASHRQPHKTVGQRINRALAHVAAMAGIGHPFTMYAARHTWATLARDAGVSIFIIKEAMGHDSIRTTQIYLASLDTRLVDEANAKIIGSLY